MDISLELQIEFFRQIKTSIPSNLSLVDKVADILDISTDSSYRRISGKKIMTLKEFYLLCLHFNISADRLFKLHSDHICFNALMMDEKKVRFNNYLSSLLTYLTSMKESSNPRLIFLLNELNLLQILQIPELAAFKLFFWSKSNIQFSDFYDIFFSFDLINDELLDLSKKIVDIYLGIPTVELITAEVLNSILKQINYYHVSGFFSNKTDAIVVCDKLLLLVDHIKKQSELGFKFHIGQEPGGEKDNFLCYYNDLVLTDNTILFSSNEVNLSFITTNAINLLHSDHPEYFKKNNQWAKNIISRSTLISVTAEMKRNKYFREIKRKIEDCKCKLND